MNCFRQPVSHFWKPAIWESTSSLDYPVVWPSDQWEMQTGAFKEPKILVAQILQGWSPQFQWKSKVFHLFQ